MKKSLSLLLALFVASLGPVSFAQEAVKDAAQATGDGAKKLGKKLKRGTKKAAKATADATEDGAKAVGKHTKKGVSKAAEGTEKGAEKLKDKTK